MKARVHCARFFQTIFFYFFISFIHYIHCTMLNRGVLCIRMSITFQWNFPWLIISQLCWRSMINNLWSNGIDSWLDATKHQLDLSLFWKPTEFSLKFTFKCQTRKKTLVNCHQKVWQCFLGHIVSTNLFITNVIFMQCLINRIKLKKPSHNHPSFFFLLTLLSL